MAEQPCPVKLEPCLSARTPGRSSAKNRVEFDQLLTESVGTLLHQGLVDLEEVAQDGVRVRAYRHSVSAHGRAARPSVRTQ